MYKAFQLPPPIPYTDIHTERAFLSIIQSIWQHKVTIMFVFTIKFACIIKCCLVLLQFGPARLSVVLQKPQKKVQSYKHSVQLTIKTESTQRVHS